MPFLFLLGAGVLIAVLASQQKATKGGIGVGPIGGKQPDYGKTTPTAFGPAPSNGKDDVGDMPEPLRSATWGAMKQAVKDKNVLALDTIASSLVTPPNNWQTASSRARMIAVDVASGHY